ncbi:Big_5 domain-containing protein [Tenacibaculum sp. 190130A14a]|uniref:Big_5 domain-containing protein n=1 Tax=Tenacibaculum polynesiense TaxID=3137857 RepID=A0ABM9P9U3_9FLAO
MKYFNQIFVLLLVLLTIGCARRGRPEGGPKDETAPIMVTASPPYESVNFKEDKIRIHFDEYIVLKELQKQLVVSPPMKNPPLITPQGTASKYINIKILDTLKPNTTYTFNFGNAVQDNNENNKLESFKYVFSTGTYIDSLSVKGNVADALEKETQKNINVLLYRVDSTYNDSIVYKRKPDYITNTLDSTLFNITNIREGKYVLLALKEEANDFIFNSKTDKIGFLKDPILLPKDSIIEEDIVFFKEIQPFQFKKAKEVSKGKIEFGFEGKQKDLKIELLSQVPNDFKYFTQFEQEKDTLNYWHSLVEADSLNFKVSHQKFIDTVTVRLRKKKVDSINVKSNISSTLHPTDTLFLTTNNPIVKHDTSKFTLIDKDTVNIDYKLQKIGINKLAVLFKQTPNNRYSLKVLPKGIIDLYETSNDSLNYSFKTLEAEDYGSIILEIKNEQNKPLIIELLQKDKVVKTEYISSSKKIEFNLLEPKEYSVRAIIDENNNRKWDTGNFLKKIQPEKIIYYETEFKLRANWVIQNEVFTIK